ncbi:hypothetical protein GALMADRAFT_236271 [Galerina marginata CBS 339.88]|uniref:RlpA-like protein double-psi beta-barrel domain-containing protein n=1 Tax=Galerina marginata (strain CBS 339.88) TaxID=685588 RepID=A0A067TL16_GALM3|nr:hypothetical protein GALMADRAFT_236271 [Galerina marginata CBS 339.88]
MGGFKAGFFAFIAMFFPILVSAHHATSARAIAESKYSTAHSLGDNYDFDPRDGWQSVNATNLEYKYRRQLGRDISDNDMEGVSNHRRSSQSKGKPGIGGTISGVLGSVIQGLKGIGKSEPVTITWYTGQDLKNPSCWADGNWAPTDQSFACALTMEGWTTRPKCFKFLEVCQSPKKCVFVRVVDTCAGCAPGSKHIDLTRAAFGQLADYDVGVLKVQFRPATDPHGWHEALWGPKVNKK